MPSPPHAIPLWAGRYWGAVFAAGFVLGTARTLWLAPRLGALGAVLAELPVMLAISAVAARRLLARRPLPSCPAALAAGGLALALLLASEALLAAALGQAPRQWAASLATPPGAAGLAGQALFALLPALLWRPPGRRAGPVSVARS